MVPVIDVLLWPEPNAKAGAHECEAADEEGHDAAAATDEGLDTGTGADEVGTADEKG